MFKKILFPTDFSPISNKALELIKQLKAGGAEEVIALHVIDDRTLIESGYVDSIRGELEEQSKKNMEALAKELEGFGLKVQTHLRTGVPFKEILDMEKEVTDLSLLIMGSHGKSDIMEMLMGSVAEKVVRKCKTPILIVKR
jgi:nucleotide-binding universal stress UspA family protein